MTLKILDAELTVCKVSSTSDLNLDDSFYFIGKTDHEISLVCRSANAPSATVARDEGWKAFYIDGELDFSLIGILSKISTILAENQIGIFAVSTYNTDYILVKNENFDKAIIVLQNEGYRITKE